MNMREATVVLLLDKNERVCLARKKRPIHNEGGEISYSLGMYNGYGGKKEDKDKTLLDTAMRELYEEVGVKGSKEDLVEKAKVYFFLKKDEEKVAFMVVIFYTLSIWSGVPKEREEMGPPIFFDKEKIPYDEMMPADKVLFKKMFAENYFEAEVILNGKDNAPEILFI